MGNERIATVPVANIQGSLETRRPDDLVILQVTDTTEAIATIVPVPLIAGGAWAVAVWLAQGAVQYVGGLAMSRILGHPSLSDVDSLIRNSIKELMDWISEELRRQIDENELRKLQSQFESVIRNLKAFDRLSDAEQPTGRYLLQDAVIKSGEAMSLAGKFWLSGSAVYANCVSTRLIALQALGTLDGLTTVKSLVKDLVEEGCTTLEPLLTANEKVWLPASRVGAATWSCGGENQYISQKMCWSWCSKDGRPLGGIANPQDPEASAKAFRDKLLAEATVEYKNVMNMTNIPLAAIMGEWKKLVS